MSDEPAGQEPQLHVDSDWKAEAQAEQDRLAEKEAADQSGQAEGAAGEGAGAGAADLGAMPEASFDALIRTLATQALFGLGLIPDPTTGQRYQHLGMARHQIDLLAIVDEKTKGNLSEDESKMLSSTLYELRQQYISVSTSQREAKR